MKKNYYSHQDKPTTSNKLKYLLYKDYILCTIKVSRWQALII